MQADLLIETVPGKSNTVADSLVEFDQVSYLRAKTGDFNPGASISADADLHNFYRNRDQHYPRGVACQYHDGDASL